LDAADFAILDLEDAVAPADKAAARQALIDNPVLPDAVIVRVNAIGTADHALDMEALRQTEYGRIMLPKAENPEAIAGLDAFEVIALCETALGVLHAQEIARLPCVVALMWGAEDLIASIGGQASRRDDGSYLDIAIHARSTVLLAAAANGKGAIDAVFIDLGDGDGLTTEASEAALSGFMAKSCIHPRQVAPVREGFQPGEELRAWAHEVLNSAAAGGVRLVGSRMVDGPMVAQALRVLAMSDSTDRPNARDTVS
jgi:citrate lyase subunit beta/citryl-CoA lyase